MKKLFTLLLICSSYYSIADSWIQKAAFPGTERMCAASFVIGGKGYVANGCNTSIWVGFVDLWEYDQLSDTWTQKANFTGHSMMYQQSFTIGHSGYLAMGDTFPDSGLSPSNQLWEFNADSNKWFKRSNIPVSLDMGLAFAIGNKGYCGLGTGHKNELWEYDPATDGWNLKSIFPGKGRTHALALTVNNRAYIGLGADTGNFMPLDFWEYEPIGNNWVQKANFPGSPNTDFIKFTLNGKLYVKNAMTNNATLWQFDPVLNLWCPKANFPPIGVERSVSFGIGSEGYVVTGSLIMGPGGYTKVLWEYVPDSVSCIEGLNQGLTSMQFSLSPNPIHNHFTISFSEFIHSPSIVIFNNIGEKVFEKNVSGVVKEIPVQFSAAAGIYFLKVREGERERVVKVAVE